VLALLGGRVVDPATGTDTVADVLISGQRVIAVGPDLARPDQAEVLDISGLLVGPGFVDLHSHAHGVAGQRLQALDGVTTALDLEAGLMPLARAYAEAEAEGRPLNFGFSASWAEARAQVLLGRMPQASLEASLDLLAEPGWQRSSTDAELHAWLDLLSRELADGALGIGVLMGYAPRTDPREFRRVAGLAAAAGAPTFTHVRELIEADPSTPIDGSRELVVAAAETGAAMHHCHVNSTSRKHIDRVLATLADSQAAGSPVTVEAYPYGAGSTAVGAFFLAPDRLDVWGLRPSSIAMVGTGERIGSLARLRELRAEQPGAECVVDFLDESRPDELALLRRSLSFPDAIVASDAMPVLWPDGRRDTRSWPLPAAGSTHPRTAGTFAKALRMMVREQGEWDWVEGFRRCSYLPARILDGIAPSMRGKGWLGTGSDADLVVLDPDVLTDRATYTEPTRPSAGVRHLLVNGEFVVQHGQIRIDSYPGRPVRGQPG